MVEKINIVAICGSLRKDSYTRKALYIALKGAKEYDTNVELIDLKDYSIPFCDASSVSSEAPDVVKISEKLLNAQGIILGTPDYHGAFSGVLKNLLDLMGFKQFEGKIIGLIGVAGGAMGAINALHGLRAIGRQLHSWVLPHQASIPRASSAFDENGNIIDKGLENRVTEVGRQVAKFAFLHHSKEMQDFVKNWEQAPINPGGTKE